MRLQLFDDARPAKHRGEHDWRHVLPLSASMSAPRPQQRKGQRLREVEAIEVHDFVPSGDEVVDELLLRVRASINFGQVAELRI